MPKHLVTALGLVVSLGVIALGVFLVALPMYFQAVTVDAQTATVAGTNAVYQAQVDALREQEQNLDEINASVADLRAQIPAAPQLDDVFEVVGRAAEETGVTLTAVTAGEEVPFAVRTGATEDDAAAAAAAPAPEPGATPPAGSTDPAVAAPTDQAVASTSGRQQVDFAITATAVDMAQATAFVDALRAGPRLLNSMTVNTTQSGEGEITVSVSALTYVDAEG